MMYYSVRIVRKTENKPLLGFKNREDIIRGGFERLCQQCFMKSKNICFTIFVVNFNSVCVCFAFACFFVCYMPKDLYERKIKRLQALMEDLEEAIQAITEEMDEVINSCPVLSRQKELLMSIDGVGRVVATNMIIVTEAFTRFEDPRKFNCYAGVAPFSYSSGSSQHSKARVSHRADKVMKRLLHLAAVAVTHRVGGELKMYYERKVAEGKNKMSVINALRAKIVARMFAVIKRNEKYKPILS